MKFHGDGRLVVVLLPGRRVCKGDGRSHLQRPKPDWLENELNDPVRSPRVLGGFPRVLELKMGVLGLGFYLAHKSRFI